MDQILLLLASMAREGSIQGLLDSMPVDLAALHEIILKRSQRSLSSASLQSLKSVIAWLVCSFQPLTLEWLNIIASSVEDFSGEFILSMFSQFFEVDYTLEGTTSHLPMGVATLFEESTYTPTENLPSDDSLRLKVRNRAIQVFFCSATPMRDLRTSKSDAHRRIFLDMVDIILQRRTSNKSLYQFSIEHSLKHWYYIIPGMHTHKEQDGVRRAFNDLISDDRYIEGLMDHPGLHCIEQITLEGWQQKWRSWSGLGPEHSESPKTPEYWHDSGGAVYPFVKAFVRHWLQSTDVERAIKACRWADNIKYWVNIKYLRRNPAETYDIPRTACQWEPLQLAGILNTKLDGRAHFAIGLVLAHDRTDNRHSAINEFLLVLHSCRDGLLQKQCYIQLASICLEKQDWSGAVEYCESALDSEQATMRQNVAQTGLDPQAVAAGPDNESQKSLIVSEAKIDDNITKTRLIRIELLRIQGAAMRGLGMNIRAATSFCEARQLQLNTEIVPAKHLFAELLCLQEDPASMIDRLLSFRSIDQFNLLTSDSKDLSQRANIPPTRVILPASINSQRKDEVIQLYQELIKALNAEQAGAPVKVDLARMLWQLRHEIKDVKSLLDQVLDSIAEPKRYKLTNRLPTEVAGSALLLMTDILLEEFGSSKRVDDKRQILLEAKELPRRSFLASQPLIDDSIWSPYSIAVAHMLRKIGPLSEYEQVLNEIYKRAREGLTDDTKSNDSMYLRSLSRILMTMPSLRELGGVLYAQRLFDVASDDASVMNYCCGICSPVLIFDDSNLEEPQYECLICANSRLCQSCFETRMQWNADPTTNPVTRLSFCCPYGQYIRVPVKKSRGVKDECSLPDNLQEEAQSTETKLAQLMQDIDVAWKKAWEDLSFGV